MKIIFQIPVSDNIFLTWKSKDWKQVIFFLYTCNVLCKTVFMLTILVKHNGMAVIFKT